MELITILEIAAVILIIIFFIILFIVFLIGTIIPSFAFGISIIDDIISFLFAIYHSIFKREDKGRGGEYERGEYSIKQGKEVK